ncbi:hypothetical protein PATSB16_22330 [Pandoraea thiooxydans]|uniref:HTH lysR-type domain-containing protein n=1 Tax=Pandoraea thiooxydans TaxID=445709 RepID=A0A0G3EMP8_9BURK|nr:LysR substrate-binding domain-containing protein [Pandoraea thiooxydans]AKJ68255.1 hypothetical protein ABW99_08565 [Pandoraea thiooxydans]APR95573.1 hypothetical protein PATSB16_22330 [Pandoraea thiooxydans]
MLPIESYFSRQLKLRHLQLLVTVADLPSVGKVAQALHVTQPAVSKMIADLERGVGVPLFERDGRRIKPTPYGACLIHHAREVLRHAGRASEALQAMANGMGGRIDVGVLSVAAPILIPEAVLRFKRHSPTATVCLHEGTLDQLLPALRAGHLDLVVGRVPHELTDDSLVSEALFDDPTVIVAARSHPLARKRKVAWQDLDGCAWIVPTVGAPMYKRLLSILAAHQVRTPVNVVESVVTTANLALLQSSAVLGLLPRSLATHYAADGILKILPLDLGGVMGPVSVAWNVGGEITPALTLFRRCLGEAARTMPNAQGHDGAP